MDRKVVIDSPEAVEFLRGFKVTNVVSGRGHDAGGLLCFLQVGNKKFVDFRDDGRGGEPEIDFLFDGAEEILRDKFEKANFAKLMFENGWDFMGSPEDIDFISQLTCAIEESVNLKEHDKVVKKTKNALIFGNAFEYRIIAWNGVKDLADLPTHVLQKAYDKYKAQLSEGQYFYNTPEQFEALGIKA